MQKASSIRNNTLKVLLPVLAILGIVFAAPLVASEGESTSQQVPTCETQATALGMFY
ncbi:hypothetical protein ACKQTC_05705 [Peptococcus simiae]|uniref:Uncharacterized protein n=1 Tax=Peptococcus simiae TaxID=1643805 RepID=A0ABW9GZ07_9FIRM